MRDQLLLIRSLMADADGKPVLPLRATGLVTRNSLAFVSAVFRLYAERRVFVPISALEAARAHPEIAFEQVEHPEPGGGWFDEQHEPQRGADIAQVNFTSGTTGTPKGILLPHDALACTTGQLIEVMGLDRTVREYVGVPPAYSFGLGRFRACAAVGARAYLPAKGFDPAELGAMLRAGEINALSAVPTMLRVLFENADLVRQGAQRMRWIEIGSQPMSRREKEQLKAIFPEARIIQHYGLTEASRSSFLDVSASEGHRLDSVGRPFGDTESAIAPDGRIMIRGRQVARQWIGLHGIAELVDSNGWLTTNDLGAIEDGFLFFRGRMDDLINFGGVKLVAEQLEQQIRERTGGPRVVVTRIPDALRGEGILVASDDPAMLPANLREAAVEVLEGCGVSPGDGLRIAVIDNIPVTVTGKIRRRALAELIAADGKQVDIPQASGEEGEGESVGPVLRAFRQAFPRRYVSEQDSLDGLGGDSLAHISIAARLDDHAGALPEGWETLSIAELQALSSSGGAASAGVFHSQAVSSEIVLRALAITVIVAHHALRKNLGGGIEVLLLLIGLNLARFQTGRLASPSPWGIVKDVSLRMVLPYLVIIAAFDLWIPHIVSWNDYLLLSNFAGRYHVPTVPYWFVPGYFQTLLVLVLISGLPLVSSLIAHQPGRFGLYLLIATLLAKVASLALFHHHALLSRTPDQFAYIIALGWCVHYARSKTARAALIVLAIAIAILDTAAPLPFWDGFHGKWYGPALVATILILFYLPSVRLPNLLRAIAIELALASLIIYLIHPIILRALGNSIPRIYLVPISLLTGVAVSHLINLGLRKATRHKANAAAGFELDAR